MARALLTYDVQKNPSSLRLQSAGRRLREKSFLHNSHAPPCFPLSKLFSVTKLKDLSSVTSNGSEIASTISLYSPRLDTHTVTRIH